MSDMLKAEDLVRKEKTAADKTARFPRQVTKLSHGGKSIYPFSIGCNRDIVLME